MQPARLSATALTLAVMSHLGCAGPATQAPAAPTIQFERITSGTVVEDRQSTGGVSLVDYDGDGDVDLFVTNGYDVSAEEAVAQPNRLYRNDGGVLVAVTSGPLAEDEGISSGSTWADMDNDGDLDCYVSNQQNQENFLYRNLGGGQFERVSDAFPTDEEGGHSYSAAWVDVDNDGLVDLFVANGGLSHSQADRLYRNLGEGRFTRITKGELVTFEANSGGSAWADYDNDGDQDVVVSNCRFGSSPRLYRNDGGFAFTHADDLLADGPFTSASAAWADVDGDADLDLMIGGLYGLASRAYTNLGGGRLERRLDDGFSVSAGSAYSLVPMDADNDGHVDVVAANWGAAPILFHNDGGGSLEPLPHRQLAAPVTFAATAARGDIDGDGRLDLVVGNWPNAPGPDEENLLLMNNSSEANWLAVELEGTSSNRSAIGARITVITSDGDSMRRQIREISSHQGWRSQSPLVQHVGLGSATTANVLVWWPTGVEQQIDDVAANQRLRIVEGQPEPTR